MTLTLNDLDLNYVTNQEEKDIALQINIKDILSGISLQRKTFLTNFAQQWKVDKIKLKEPIFNLKITIQGTKTKLKDELQKLKNVFLEKKAIITNKIDVNYIAKQTTLLNIWKENELSLLEFSESFKKKKHSFIEKVNKEYYKKIQSLKTYVFPKQKANEMLVALEQITLDNKTIILENTKKKLSDLEFQLKNKKDQISRKIKDSHNKMKKAKKQALLYFKQEIKLAKQNYKLAQAEIKRKNIYINALFNPIKETNDDAFYKYKTSLNLLKRIKELNLNYGNIDVLIKEQNNNVNLIENFSIEKKLIKNKIEEFRLKISNFKKWFFANKKSLNSKYKNKTIPLEQKEQKLNLLNIKRTKHISEYKKQIQMLEQKQVKIKEVFRNKTNSSNPKIISISKLEKFLLKYYKKESSSKNKVLNNEEIKLVKKIDVLKAKVKLLNDKKDGNFNYKYELLETSTKLKHHKNILEVIKKYNNKISSAKAEYLAIDKNLSQKNKATTKNVKNSAKKKLNSELKRIHYEYTKKVFSKTSLKNSRKILKQDFISTITSQKLQDPVKNAKDKIKFLKLEKQIMIDKEIKIMHSIIDDSSKLIPTKVNKNLKYFTSVLSLILPGTGQLINKQYLKASLLLLFSMLIWGVLIPYGFGIIKSTNGQGIFGLINLSPDLGDGFFKDARFRLIEGIISLLFITVSFIGIIASSRDAYQTSQYASLGIRAKNNRDLKRYLTSNGLPLILATPAFVIILFIIIVPLIATILLAFTDYGIVSNPSTTSALNWVGFENFQEILNGEFARSFTFVSIWTLIWTVSVSLGVILVGTIMALVVDNVRIKGKIIWTTVFVLPWAVPAFSTILFFSAAFASGGIYNTLFNTDILFKDNANIAKLILISIQIWLGHSYIFLLITGVKKSISKDYYEAASIDGASKWTQFWKITAPIILFQILPLLIGQVVFNFNNFGIIFLFNQGGPATIQSYAGSPGATDIIISLIFKLTTSSPNKIAYASAFTIIISIIIVSVSAAAFLRSKTFREEGI